MLRNLGRGGLEWALLSFLPFAVMAFSLF